MRPIPLLTLLALGAAALMAPAASARGDQVSVMQDDDALLYRGSGTMQETMRRMRDAGVDMVRVTVLWSVVAENAFPSRQRSVAWTARATAAPPSASASASAPTTPTPTPPATGTGTTT